MSSKTFQNPAIAALLAKIKSRQAETLPPVNKITEALNPSPASLVLSQSLGRHGELITYNVEQQSAINLALSGSNLVLIGAAGTGKTTTMRGLITALIQSGKIPTIQDNKGHKYLNARIPGIVACSFTRRAVANLRKAMPPGLEGNCITIHKLLEYSPVDYFTLDPVTGEEKKTMRFEPSRNAYNTLPSEIKVIVVDEASMVSVALKNQIEDALGHSVQWIFLGDIHQLPPVFGSATLGFRMLDTPVVELIQVYRQALESPIIKYATDIKDGTTFTLEEKLVVETPRGKVTFHPWRKKLSSDVACATFNKFVTVALDHGSYCPETDMILIPFNKAFGTVDVNKAIASHIAKKNGRVVWEVIAGFNKLYFSEGDRVLYDKEDAVVTKIVRNATYYGKKPQRESVTLDYDGHNSNITPASSGEDSEYSEDQIDTMLEAMASFTGKDDERVRAASHIITVEMCDTGEEVEVSTASDLNTLLLSYALTVHKAQGSEWNKVFFILHQSHATMLQRELLYTGFTRAAKEIYVICEPETFVNGVRSQKIKGNTLEEKAEYFKGKEEDTLA